MALYCTRPACDQPRNDYLASDSEKLLTAEQFYCTTCGSPLILKDRYVPQKFLGRGGFGTTLIGRDRHKPRLPLCVIKVLQPPSHFSPDQLQKAKTLFDREAEALYDLGNQHPHIPNLYAFFQERGVFYLVQEFIDGESLEQRVALQGPLPEPEVRKVLTSMLTVIDFVHTNEHLHRDIKPSNIMQGHDGELYLIDFGAVKRATGVTTSQPTGVYTRGFAAPEILRGGHASITTDLYSLAVTCLVLLTGKPPAELSDPDLNRWHWHSMGNWQDRSLIAALDQMLQDCPTDRYSSAPAVLAALAPVVPDPVPPEGKKSPRIRQRFWLAPLPRFITGAAFNGFEAGLLAIATLSLVNTIWLSSGLWIVCVAGLIALQLSQKVKQTQLAAITGATALIVLLLPALHQSIPFLEGALRLNALGFSVAAAIYCVAIALIFRLVYRLTA